MTMTFGEWLKAKPGRVRAVAERFGIGERAVYFWTEPPGVPPKRMLDILEMSDGEVSLASMLQDRKGRTQP